MEIIIIILIQRQSHSKSSIFQRENTKGLKNYSRFVEGLLC